MKLDADDTESRVRIGGYDLRYAEAMVAHSMDRYPTTLFLEPNRHLVSPVRGYFPTGEYLRLLECFALREFERGNRDGSCGSGEGQTSVQGKAGLS